MHEYEDAAHIVFQAMNVGFVMALCFTQMKRPHHIGIAIEVPDCSGILEEVC